MGRMVDIANTIRHSGARLGPLDAVFAGLDYKQGLDEGEDHFRAGGGAAISTAGGWGGALAGGTAGMALGPVGGAVGAIAGGIAGSLGAGWGFDRADEVVRGNTNKKPTDSGWGAPLAAGAGILGAAQLLKGKIPKMAPNPFRAIGDVYDVSRGLGANKLQAGLSAAQSAGKYGIDAAGKVIKHPAAIGGAVLVGGVLVDQATGQPIEGGIDAVTGGRTNLRANEDDELGRRHEQGRMLREQKDLRDQQAQIQGTADDALSISDKYAKDAGEFGLMGQMYKDQMNPDSALNQRTREIADLQDIANEQRGNRVGAFNQVNAMAKDAQNNYWNNRASSAQTIASMFR